MNLPGRIEFGAVLRYIDKLPQAYVSDYIGLDVRLGWKVNRLIELNVVGQNLVKESHTEFIPESPLPKDVERSVYVKAAFRF